MKMVEHNPLPLLRNPMIQMAIAERSWNQKLCNAK